MTSRAIGREPAPVRMVATAIAEYEAVALWTNLPTVTRMNEKCPLVGLSILIGLTLHFYPVKSWAIFRRGRGR